MRIQPDAPYSLTAPAKINLCLELLGRREDGFHELRTLMATVRLCDRVQVRPTEAPDLRLTVQGSPADTRGVSSGPSNLVLRALEALRNECGVAHGAAVRLLKRIPNQAGLGGGSSNAAAAMIAGNRVWKLGLPTDRLTQIAAQIGSDVPFFVQAIQSRVLGAIGEGRGERIRPVALRGGAPVVIVKPDAGLSTADVYKNCQESDFSAKNSEDRCALVASSLRRGDLAAASTAMTNGLEWAAGRVCSLVRSLRETFDQTGLVAHQLSGSGSAYFGLARTWREARLIAVRLRALRIGRVFVTTIG